MSRWWWTSGGESGADLPDNPPRGVAGRHRGQNERRQVLIGWLWFLLGLVSSVLICTTASLVVPAPACEPATPPASTTVAPTPTDIRSSRGDF